MHDGIYTLALIAALGLAACEPDLPPGLGDKVSDADFEVVVPSGPEWGIGRDLQLSDLEGKPVVLDFWASWCGPCRLQHEYVTELQAQYGDRIQVVGVLFEDTEVNARQYVRENGANFPTVQDLHGTLAKEFWIRGIPRLVVLTPDRRLSWDQLGAGGTWGQDSVAARLDAMAGS